ncbi:MAG: hypothetical protein CBB68_12870 [Rhodospirillaceae bacterium TMED8]|nr:succinate dehydrogenase [Magnetovibrio sp.]OUT48999.1 MAG: hypothetical protein CBB68_12870 [Rhodospirillaceae bacterium TMED8]|tara:strand:+ start:9356 stop:9715 length:360 start_codon:yes stop_codon:yes gene_type:complete
MSASKIQVEARLWLAQRLSAFVLALGVIIHLVTIVYAVRGGLSASEVVDRVGGNLGWSLFYGIFVVAVAVHAPIGLRAILNEMTSLTSRRVDLLCFIAATFLVVTGLRTVLAFHHLRVG